MTAGRLKTRNGLNDNSNDDDDDENKNDDDWMREKYTDKELQIVE